MTMAYQQACVSDSEWPDLIGKTWQESEKMIRRHYPNITIQVIPEHSMLTTDRYYNPVRVRIPIDGEGKVVQTPRIG